MYIGKNVLITKELPPISHTILTKERAIVYQHSCLVCRQGNAPSVDCCQFSQESVESQFVGDAMNIRVLLACCVLSSFVSSPAAAGPTSHESKIVNNDGKEIGTLTLTDGTDGVVISISAKELPPGYHGMHFHAKGDCSDLQKFSSAGGHVDPHKKPHGFLNEKGPHEGNLPNLIVGSDGTVQVELYSNLVRLNDGEAKLLDEDGSSLIVHVNRDDHKTQPIGGSGGRIACSEIKPLSKQN